MKRDMIIKVCGMREAENIRAVSALDIDMLGMIFWERSPRCVHNVPEFKKTGNLSNKVMRVGVFVDELPQNIITSVYNYQLDFVQLHGNESRTLIENLRRTLDPDIKPGIKIIKAISVEKPSDIERCRDYAGAVDMFLFDTKTPLAGGSGRQFDWTVLQGYDGDVPFLLSGGIGPEDAERVKNFSHPRFAGIDLNSRFETEPGVKDVEELKTFIQSVRDE